MQRPHAADEGPDALTKNPSGGVRHDNIDDGQNWTGPERDGLPDDHRATPSKMPLPDASVVDGGPGATAGEKFATLVSEVGCASGRSGDVLRAAEALSALSRLGDDVGSSWLAKSVDPLVVPGDSECDDNGLGSIADVLEMSSRPEGTADSDMSRCFGRRGLFVDDGDTDSGKRSELLLGDRLLSASNWRDAKDVACWGRGFFGPQGGLSFSRLEARAGSTSAGRVLDKEVDVENGDRMSVDGLMMHWQMYAK